jgi:hypothetical protein
VVQLAQQKFGIDPAPFFALIDVREKKVKLKDIHPKELFARYLEQVQVVVDAVDRIER